MPRFRLATLAVILVSLIGAFFTSPGTADAAEFKNGDVVRVTTSQTIDDDLYASGREIEIAGRVTGDVVAAGGTIEVPGDIDGSLQVIGGTVEIDGRVGSAVRIAAGDVKISGQVDGDVLLASGTLTLLSEGAIDGDVFVAGGDIEILGTVSGDVTGDMGTLTINNRIGGDVDVNADRVSLLSKARVAGDLLLRSRDEPTLASGAVVTGRTEVSEPEPFSPGDNLATWLLSGIFRLLCALIAGLVLISLLPRTATAVADAARLAPFTSLLTGILLLFVLPIVLTLLLVTVVGIPIGLIGWIAFVAVLYLSQVFLGLAIGRIILPKRWDTVSRGYNLLAMTIGVLILGGLRMLPVPFVSVAVASVTAVLGLGAVVVALRASRRPPALPSY